MARPATRWPPMSEAQLLAAVLEAAATYKWLAYHTHRSDHSEAGFPDLILVRGARLLAVELKRDGARPTPAQQKWLDALELAGTVTMVWRPVDWHDGTIEETLRPTRRR